MEQINLIYFSGTGTTRKCVDTVAEAVGLPVACACNLADNMNAPLPSFDKSHVLLVAAPVYGGRLPKQVAEKFRQIQASGTRAIAMVVYGNRDFDDALLELTDILTAAGCCVVAAAAFIGQHSIFPKAGSGRPDASDILKLKEFGSICKQSLAAETTKTVEVRGNRPYKAYGAVPLHPHGVETKCQKCGSCVRKCPTGAIDDATPWQTNPDICISCGRCIVSCPTKTRGYGGLKYNLVGKIFSLMFSKRREPEIF